MLSKSLSYLLICSWIIFAGINLYPSAEARIMASKNEFYEQLVHSGDRNESYEQTYGYTDKWIYALWYRAWVVLFIGLMLYFLYMRNKIISLYYLSCSLGAMYCFYITELYNTISFIKGSPVYGSIDSYVHLLMLLTLYPSPINELLSIIFFLCLVVQIIRKGLRAITVKNSFKQML